MTTPTPTQDASAKHWIYRLPKAWVPYAQLSRLDRPVGYWLLALPGWMGLAFAGLSVGLAAIDILWAGLLLIGAIAMRGAGCTYNDIVDRDLDAQVARTALRPIPAGTVSVRQAKLWMFAQIGVGFLVWLCLPLFAKGVALLSLPLVAAYPFMKRITWWPQIWLGLTFNWAFLVAVAIKTGTLNVPSLIFYVGLIFWTVGYDTIYACQDIDDDALVGIKSTARLFGNSVKVGVALCYVLTVAFMLIAIIESRTLSPELLDNPNIYSVDVPVILIFLMFFFPLSLFFGHLVWQIYTLDVKRNENALEKFKSNVWAAALLILPMLYFASYE